MIKLFVALFGPLLAILLKARPSEVEVKAAKVATLTEDLKSNVAEEKSLAELAAVRVAGDNARIMRDPEANMVNTDPAAAVNTDPDAHFRD